MRDVRRNQLQHLRRRRLGALNVTWPRFMDRRGECAAPIRQILQVAARPLTEQGVAAATYA
jgi:hypothetical protein